MKGEQVFLDKNILEIVKIFEISIGKNRMMNLTRNLKWKDRKKRKIKRDTY